MKLPQACESKDCNSRWSDSAFKDLHYHGGHETSTMNFCSEACRDKELRRRGYKNRADGSKL
jgi:hypothetical protein